LVGYLQLLRELLSELRGCVSLTLAVHHLRVDLLLLIQLIFVVVIIIIVIIIIIVVFFIRAELELLREGGTKK
jgi:hypothetical protein